jgi:uncharacterized protein (PEP-CTERM system associated)
MPVQAPLLASPRRVCGAALLRCGVAGLAALVTTPALAQAQVAAPAETPRARELSFGVGASETVFASVRPGRSRVDEAVTQISPSVRWSSYSGRLRGNLSYGVSLRRFAGDNDDRTDKTDVSQSLSASARAELIDNVAFIDLGGSIGQQAISGLEVQPGGSLSRPSSNRSEIVNLSASPYIIGSLGGLATYELRYGFSASDGSDDAFANRSSQSLSLGVRSQGSGVFGWGLSASTSKTDIGDRADARGERVGADITIRPDIDWRIVVSGGAERTDVGTPSARTYDNWGASVAWSPSARTRVDFGTERRFFGDSHRLGIEYRTPRTVFRYGDVRDVNNGNQFGGVSPPITLFQLFFAQFASIQPDQALREQLVLQYLASIGRDPNELLFIEPINRGISVQRRRELSAAWLGIRASATVQAYANDNELLAGPNTGTAAGAGGKQRQYGLSLSASYRLTERTSLSSGLALSRSPSAGGPRNEGKSASLGLSSQLGRRTSAALSARYSVLNGGPDPYREASVTASVNLSF